jgi:undecaprenyl-diphosphatase
VPNGLDENILYFFNRTLSTDWLDLAMKFVTNSRNWIPFYGLVAIGFVWRYKWEGFRIVVAAAVLIGLANMLTNVLLKEIFMRPRPCAEVAPGIRLLDWVRLPDGMRYGFSMPSSHAVNNFAGAMFFSLLFPKRLTIILLFVAAFVVAMTRVYLGLHYPSDTLAGALIGIAIGYLFVKGYAKVEKKYFWGKESD